MLRNLARVFAVLIAAVLAGAFGLYALLVAGSRRGIEYYYGR
jgi:hypothetical protein